MGSSLILFNFFAIVFLEFSLFHQWRKELWKEEDQGFSFLFPRYTTEDEVGSSLILFNFFAIVFLEFSLFHQWRNYEGRRIKVFLFYFHDTGQRTKFLHWYSSIFLQLSKACRRGDILHYLSQKVRIEYEIFSPGLLSRFIEDRINCI